MKESKHRQHYIPTQKEVTPVQAFGGHLNSLNHSLETVQLKSKPPIQLAPWDRDNFSSDQRRRILAKNAKRNGGFHTCAHCGFQHSLSTYAKHGNRRIGDASFHVDHITPASHGGRALVRNARVLCGTCNTSRGNRAIIKKTGRQKYRALHRSRKLRVYKRKPR